MEKLLSRAQVAEFLGVPIGTLHEWASKGTGPRYFRVGRHTRYRVADVEAWLESRSKDPAGTASS